MEFVLALLTMLIIMNVLNVQLKFPQKSLKFVIAASTLIVFYNFNYLKGTQIGLSSLGGSNRSDHKSFIYLCSKYGIFKQANSCQRDMRIAYWPDWWNSVIRAWEVNIENIVSSGNLYFLLGALLWSGVTIFAQKNKRRTPPFEF